MAQSQSQFNKYDVQHVPFNLVSYRLPEPESADSSCLFELPLPMEIYPAGNCEILTDRLPPPEATPGWGDFPRSPNIVEPKGVTGAITRWFKGIPPCVWVVNEHDGPITVVISKYRPNRLFAGGGLNVSPTGGGLDVNLTTFLSPATRKTLSPRQDKGGNMGVFPLWTRKEGFGVITIFRQQDNQPYIENDCIPAGAIASFRNSANLSITNLASSN